MTRTRKNNNKTVKGGNAQSFIDQQIVHLHQAMAQKLCTHPELVVQVQNTLNTRYENGTMRYGAYLTWQCILELLPNTEVFIAAVVEESELMRKYRRRTPFVGILNEDERNLVLNEMNTQ